MSSCSVSPFEKTSLIAVLFTVMVMTSAGGSRAPDFRLERLDGTGIYEFGSDPDSSCILLEFWSTCCGTRLSRMAYLDELIQLFGDRNLKVFSINVDSASARSRVNPAVRKFGFRFPVLLDPFQETLKRYHPPMTLPYTVIIDANGDILKEFTGETSGKETQIRMMLDEILPPVSTGDPS